METIDGATGEAVEAESTPAQPDNVFAMPDGEARAERVKAQRKPRPTFKRKPALSALDNANEFAAKLPDELSASVNQAVEGARMVGSAGLDIGKLLLIGVGVYLFLEMTADRKLKRYSED